MSKLLMYVLVVALAPCLFAQSQRDDLTPYEIAYTLSADASGKLNVSMDIDEVARPIVRLAMPNWAPGAYRITRYGEGVKDLLVKNADGEALDVTQLDHQTWSVATRGARKLHVEYRLESSDRRFAGRGRNRENEGAITGLHFQGPATFMYVVDHKHEPVTVTYRLPEGWKLANGLLQTSDPMIRRARDYDTFIDAPTIIGNYLEKTFDVDGTPFSCVFLAQNQTYDFDVDRFVSNVEKIVREQGRIFGSFPFPNYYFLYTISNQGGGGGLEHLNSTSIGLSAQGLKQDSYSGMSVTSHEFFHLWNVKRIRPKTLGPFEYQHENYTGNLWVSEGWTSYYGDLTLVRSGILARDQYLRQLEFMLRSEFNKESRLTQSVYWASRNVWHRRQDELPRVDYYAKGETLGMLIDLEMRRVTGNRKSLDDVMRFMNRWFAERGQGFEESDVERACTAISNHDFSEFFARHVQGTLDPDFASLFATAGIKYEANRRNADFPFSWGRLLPSRPGIMNVRLQTGEKPTFQRGDVILSLDGKTDVQPTEFLADKSGGESVKVVYLRDGVETEAEITLKKVEIVEPKLSFMETVPAEVAALRESWLSGR